MTGRGRSKLLLGHGGFTLIEILVTVAILSFGMVAIYDAFFVSLDTYGYYTRYLDTQDWLNARIWEMQAQLMSDRALEEGQTAGTLVRGHKTFDWRMAVRQIDVDQRLYQVDLALTWREGDRTIKAGRTAYLIPAELRVYHAEGSV